MKNTGDVSYKKLWHILVDRDMNKTDLQKGTGIGWAAISKLSKGEVVSTETLIKICAFLKCNIGDILDVVATTGAENGKK